MIHRDLKPSNIMIDGRGNVRLMDFGIAALQDGVASPDQTSGTPAYMAPELFDGAGPSIQTDLYALGLVLYELSTGQRPFAGSVPPVGPGNSDTTPTAPSSVIADMDPLVEPAILACLAIDPAERPSSVYELLRMLPGGDPLAAAMAAGQTPSPQMVAASGEAGVLGRSAAFWCLAAVFAALMLAVWLAQSTYLVNQVTSWKHPEVLADEARRAMERWGYTEPPGDQAWGFLKGKRRTNLAFGIAAGPSLIGWFPVNSTGPGVRSLTAAPVTGFPRGPSRVNRECD